MASQPSSPRRPSRFWRLVKFFDPAEEGFLRRMLRCAGMVAIIAVLALCVLAAVAARSQTGRFFVAYMLTHAGQYELALPRTAALVEDYPTSNWHYYRLKALNLRHLGRYQESLEVYDQAIAAMPDQWWAHSHRCFYNALLGDPAAVMDSCDRSVELVPDEPTAQATAYDRRAIARALTGDRQGAIADFEKALELWDEDASGYSQWQVEARRRWLERLRAGQEPYITAEELRIELGHY